MAVPYYEHAGITIYHGDCLEVLPAVDFDVVVSDPPFGSGWHLDLRSRKQGAPLIGTHHYEPWDIFDLAWLNLTLDKPIALFTSHLRLAEVICRLGKTARVGYWRKTCPLPISPPTEPVVVRGISIPAGSEWVGYNGPHPEHPTQKPIGLMKWILLVSPEGVVVDPFMGSGSTLRAAKDLGRQAIGIEIEERYCEIAANRLRQEVLL